ncbi:MAG: hypothetical protein ACK4NW_12495 [Roseinatronobacter sp.]
MTRTFRGFTLTAACALTTLLVAAPVPATAQDTGPSQPLSISEWNYMGAWRRAQVYERGDVVTFQGGSFIALTRSRRVEPEPGVSTPEWGPLAMPGETGPEGPEGPEGRRGPRGAIGPEGPAGPEGARGPRGVAGAEGPEGPRGPRGVAGATGPQGPAGVSNMNFGSAADTTLAGSNYIPIISMTITVPTDGQVWMNADYGVRFRPLAAPQNVTCMVNSNDAGFTGARFKFTAIETTSVIQDHSGSIANLLPVTAGQHIFVLRCMRSELSNTTTEILFPTMTLMFFEQTTR